MRAHSRIYRSRHSIRHSLRPSRLRSHSMPSPVHSTLVWAIFSVAAVASAPAVVLSMSATTAVTVALISPVAVCVKVSPAAGRFTKLVPGRGWNQLLPKSKKHRSDQLHDVRKRTSSRNEQYRHGRLRKYVQTKKRNMKDGDALVGMKRRGSQLQRTVVSANGLLGCAGGKYAAAGAAGPGGVRGY